MRLRAVFEMLALLEFLHEPLEVGAALPPGGSTFSSALAEVEVHLVARRELRVVLEQQLEPIDRARIPADPVVEPSDFELRRRSADRAPRAASPSPPASARCSDSARRTSGTPGSRRAFPSGRAAAIASAGSARCPACTARSRRARFVGIEREELLELGDRQHQRFGRAFAEIRVADPQLGVGPERALRVGFGDLLEVLARREPLLLLQRLVALLEEELIGLRRAWRDGCAAARRAARNAVPASRRCRRATWPVTRRQDDE